MLHIFPENDWEELASCRSVDSELWFPERGQYNYQAVKICQDCPVQRECLTLSMDSEQEFGIWGGVLAHQRLMHWNNYKCGTLETKRRIIDNLLKASRIKNDNYLKKLEATKEREKKSHTINQRRRRAAAKLLQQQNEQSNEV